VLCFFLRKISFREGFGEGVRVWLATESPVEGYEDGEGTGASLL